MRGRKRYNPMKKRFCALVLAVVALLASLPAMAAGGGSMGNFTPIRSYDGRFTDVAESSWYYDNIAYLYELGLTDGQTASSFGVSANITIGEALSFAARIHSTYYLGGPEIGPQSYYSPGMPWYTPYLHYLSSSGISTAAQFSGQYSHSATRAQMACILGNILPDSEFPAINDTAVTMGYAQRLYITDVNDYTPYQSDILQLYRWGILTGSDSRGSFYPDAYITRSEFAAMLTRLVNPSLRLTLAWDVTSAYSAEGTTYADLVQGGLSYTTHPLEAADAIDANIRHMLKTGSNTITLRYDPASLTRSFVTDLMNRYLSTIRTYIEQGYNAVTCNYSTSSGTVTLRFYSSLFSDNLFSSAREKTMEAAIAVHDHLWQTGTVTAGMTEWEKARAYYTWICDNTAYDYRATDTSLSHSAYSLFTIGSAVCDGYTAAYNLLLKLEGIACSTASTTDHIWTVATLDGTTVHIDPTWGDQAGYTNYTYFGMTPAFSLSRFQ